MDETRGVVPRQIGRAHITKRRKQLEWCRYSGIPQKVGPSRRFDWRTMDSRTLVLMLCVTLAGCGGGPQSTSTPASTGTPSTPTPPAPATPPDISGAWTFTAKSSTAGTYFAVQANLTKQSATEYFSDRGNTNFYTGTPDANGDGSIDAAVFAAPCDDSGIGAGPNKFFTTLNVTFAGQDAAALEISNINNGTDYTGTLQFSSDGNSATGTYTTSPTPNACKRDARQRHHNRSEGSSTLGNLLGYSVGLLRCAGNERLRNSRL